MDMSTHTEEMFGGRTEPRRDRQVAMALGGVLMLLGVVAMPNLVALALVVWLLYAVAALVRGPEA